MATLNISLTPELASRFNEQDALCGTRLEALKKEIAIGTGELERSEYSVFTSGKELAAKIKAEGRKRVENRENFHA